MPNRQQKGFDKLQNIGSWQILLPSLLGIGVVGYLMWKNFDLEAFQRITWNSKTVLWISFALFLYSIRHLAYSWRLKMISDHFFSWKKSIQLIFLWEFASAISPTALGGSATALVLVSQEKLPGGKSVTIILYSVVLDTIFFVLAMPLFYMIFGNLMIRPASSSIIEINGFLYSFIIVLGMMTAYGFFFFYGLFINPKQLKRILLWISKWRILKRFRPNLERTANQVVAASEELKSKPLIFHLKCFLATAIAWGIRFSIIPFLIFGLVQVVSFNWNDFLLLWSRYITMFSITAFSPTPGGSGVAEALFGGFFTDFVQKENAFIIAVIWRLITYYSYLFIGIIILPQWLAHIRKLRRISKIKKEEGERHE